MFAEGQIFLTGLPVIHLDREFWLPGWVEPPKAEWQQQHAGLIAREQWIIDGNYGGTMEARFQAADTVIYLDLPRLVCLWSVIRRRFSSARRGRPDMADGLQDKLDLEFLMWIWTFPQKRRPTILGMLEALPTTTTVVRLRSRIQVHDYLDNLAVAA